jgi:hypothetical protein
MVTSTISRTHVNARLYLFFNLLAKQVFLQILRPTVYPESTCRGLTYKNRDLTTLYGL